MIHLRSVQCPHCGAALKLVNDAEQVTCAYCGQTFLIERTQGAGERPGNADVRTRNAGARTNGAADPYGMDPAAAAAKRRRGSCVFLLLAVVVVFLAAGVVAVVRNALEGKYSQSGAEQLSGAETAVEEIDPFDGLEVSYEGISGSAYVTVRSSSKNPVIRALDFQAEPFRNLRTGDTVKVTVQANDDQTRESFENELAGKGVKLTAWSREYTVGELDRYADDFGALPQDVEEALRAQAVRTLAEQHTPGAKVAQTEDWTPVEAYLLNSKEDESNLLYYVCRAAFSTETGGETVVFNAVCFDRIVIKTDGSVGTSYRGSPGWNMTWLPGSNEYVNGFTSEEELFLQEIKAKESEYRYQTYEVKS